MLRMSHSFYMATSGVIFIFVALVHGIRAFYGWEVMFHTWEVPIWISWLAALIGFLMALTAIRYLH
jgi:hypothetical protein